MLDLQSSIANLVTRLLALGTSPEAIGLAVATLISADQQADKPTRSKHAISQAKYMENKKKAASNGVIHPDHSMIITDQQMISADHNRSIIVKPMSNIVTLKQETPVKKAKVERTIMNEVFFDDWPQDYGEIFWKAYPKKNQKAKVIALLGKIRSKGNVSWKELMDGLSSYANNLPEWQSWCWPYKWLNEERWNSNPSEEENGRKRSRSSIIQASDRLIDAISSFDAGIDRKAKICGAAGEDDVRVLSNRGSQ